MKLVGSKIKDAIDDYMDNHGALPSGWLGKEIEEAIRYGYTAAMLDGYLAENKHLTNLKSMVYLNS